MEPPTNPVVLIEFKSALLQFTPGFLDFADKWAKEHGYTHAILFNEPGGYSVVAMPPDK